MTSSTAEPTRQHGLTSLEAARRLEAHGPNTLPTTPPRGILSRILGQLRDPMILLLLAAAMVTTAIGDVTDTVVIVLVVVLNSVIGVVQEVRADRAISELDRLAAPVARVLRDGVLVDLPGADVVVEDMVAVDAGDVVPADLLVVESHDLEVDEAAMTGESQPVARTVGEQLSSGTVVTRGRAAGSVLRTGRESGLGQIAALIASAGVTVTPLQARLRRLSRELVLLVLLAAALVLALGVVRGRDVTEMLITAVSLAVAAVPESLPAVVSVSLALGAHRMAKRSALVRRLPAVETLGSVTVLASDKTGTLTEGRMVATAAWTPPDREYTVSGQGYAPHGAVLSGEQPVEGDGRLERLLRDVALCNDARLLPPTQDVADWTAAGDPLEAALLALAAKGGVDPAAARVRWERQTESPFQAERGWMATSHQNEHGGWLTVCKGAPEALLEVLAEDEPVLARAREETERLAGLGCRVLAVADGPAPSMDGAALRLAGLVGITDPPRTASRGVVEACAAAGIRVLLVTGDHPVTARVIASQVGITGPGSAVVTGADVAEERHAVNLDDVAVYARIRPEQKVRIVRDLQERGHVVAMTGDGVNDAPALRTADIGVAMGKGGTEVARQAADLVLADDDLATIVVAVEEGRRVYANVRNFLRYAVSGGVAEVLVMLAGPFLGVALPLLPAQILWVNLLTHGLPGVAFGAEPASPSAMRQPSRSPRESVLGGGLARQIGLIGAVIAVASLGAGLVAEKQGLHQQSVTFVTLGLAQLGVALALRARTRRTLRERGLEAAVLAASLLQVLAVQTGLLQELLGTQSLPPRVLLVLLVVAAAPGLLVRLLMRRGEHGR